MNKSELLVMLYDLLLIEVRFSFLGGCSFLLLTSTKAPSSLYQINNSSAIMFWYKLHILDEGRNMIYFQNYSNQIKLCYLYLDAVSVLRSLSVFYKSLVPSLPEFWMRDSVKHTCSFPRFYFHGHGFRGRFWGCRSNTSQGVCSLVTCSLYHSPFVHCLYWQSLNSCNKNIYNQH